MIFRQISLWAVVALVATMLSFSCKNGKQDAVPVSTGAPAVHSAGTTSAAPESASLDRLSLQDVQGLYGGQNLWVFSNGRVVAQVVERGQKEKRYELTLTSGELAEIEALLAKNDFAKIEIKERPGVPDEARPTISVTTADGKVAEVAKWANDEHPGFDAIYKYLLAVVARAKEANKLLYEGTFDYAWRPDSWQ